MFTIAVVEGNHAARARYLAARNLPDNYMEDFTILGIEVSDYRTAHGILQNSGYELTDCPGGGDIRVSDRAHLPQIIQKLAEYGLQPRLSDIADTIYQA